MDHLIRKAATGTPEEFAHHLGIPRSTMFEYIAYLQEEMRAPIVYDNRGKTYKYEYSPKFFIGSDENWKPFNDPDIEDSDIIDEDMDSTQLYEIYGGENNEDWDTNSNDDDSDDIRLDDDIDFNDLFPNEYI